MLKNVTIRSTKSKVFLAGIEVDPPAAKPVGENSVQ